MILSIALLVLVVSGDVSRKPKCIGISKQAPVVSPNEPENKNVSLNKAQAVVSAYEPENTIVSAVVSAYKPASTQSSDSNTKQGPFTFVPATNEYLMVPAVMDKDYGTAYPKYPTQAAPFSANIPESGSSLVVPTSLTPTALLAVENTPELQKLCYAALEKGKIKYKEHSSEVNPNSPAMQALVLEVVNAVRIAIKVPPVHLDRCRMRLSQLALYMTVRDKEDAHHGWGVMMGAYSNNGGVLTATSGVYAGEKMCGFPGSESVAGSSDQWYSAAEQACVLLGDGHRGTVVAEKLDGFGYYCTSKSCHFDE